MESVRTEVENVRKIRDNFKTVLRNGHDDDKMIRTAFTWNRQQSKQPSGKGNRDNLPPCVMPFELDSDFAWWGPVNE